MVWTRSEARRSRFNRGTASKQHEEGDAVILDFDVGDVNALAGLENPRFSLFESTFLPPRE